MSIISEQYFWQTTNTTSDHMKHVDIHYHLLCEYVKDGMVKIKFVISEEIDADLFMKNLPRNLFEKHAKKLGRK